MFAKVFASLWNGTMMGKPNEQLVFIYLLCNADRKGYVDIHPKVISLATGLPEPDVIRALAYLEAADFQSRTDEHQGRRIVRLNEHRDWGWHIVNYEKYRHMRDMDDVRAAGRERVARHRDRKRVTPCNESNANADADAEADVDAEKQKDSSLAGARCKRRSPEGEARTTDPADKDWVEAFVKFFWPDYLGLRKCSKAAAFKAWMAVPHRKGQEDFDALDAAFQSDIRSWKAEGRDAKYIPHAASWLNDYRRNLTLKLVEAQ